MKVRHFCTTIERMPMQANFTPVKEATYKVLKYDMKRKDYVVTPMALSEIFPSNINVYFVANYPSVTVSNLQKKDNHTFTYEEPDKVKVSLDDTELKLVKKTKSSLKFGSEYYSTIMQLQKLHQFDKIVSISSLSVNQLMKFAKDKESRELQYFILPETENADQGKFTSFTYKETRSSTLEILKSLEIAEDALSVQDIDPNRIGHDFEALIKAGKIYNLKTEYRTIDYARYGVMLGVCAMIFIGATAINNAAILFSFGNQKTAGVQSPTLKSQLSLLF